MRTQITLVGNLGRDPASKEAGSSTVCSFSVAANRKVKGEDHTDWFNVDAWGKLGELCQEYLEKGRSVVVVGSFEPRTYEKDGETRTSLDVRATDVHFIGGRDAASSTAQGDPDNAPADDDDIPF